MFLKLEIVPICTDADQSHVAQQADLQTHYI